MSSGEKKLLARGYLLKPLKKKLKPTRSWDVFCVAAWLPAFKDGPMRRRTPSPLPWRSASSALQHGCDGVRDGAGFVRVKMV